MSHVTIHWSDLVREVSIGFDPEFPISYEDFLAKSEYLELFRKFRDVDPMSNSIFSVIFGHFNDSEWIHPDLIGKLEILAQYDLEERYACKNNIQDLKSLFWMEFDTPNYLGELLSKGKITHGTVNDDMVVSMLKYVLKGNHFLGSQKLRKKFWGIWDAKLLHDGFEWIFTQHETELKEYRSSVRTKVRYYEEVKSHNRFEYASLIAFILAEPIVLVGDSHFSSFHLVFARNIGKYTGSWLWVVYEIGSMIRGIFGDKWIGIAEEVRFKHSKEKIPELFQTLFHDLLDVVWKVGTGQIAIDLRNERPERMHVRFKAPVESFHKTKDFVGGNGVVGFERYKDVNVAVIGEKKYKYGDEGWKSDENE